MSNLTQQTDKDETIKSLQQQLERARAEANLETVEEALCAQCKRSMEESLLGEKQQAVQLQMTEARNEEMALRVDQLQRQLQQYKERMTFLETIEQE